MKNPLKMRLARFGRLPTAVLVLALAAGFGSVGQAQDMPELVVTAEHSELGETTAALRDGIQAQAEFAVWQTRMSVAFDLGLRLTGEDRPSRVAGKHAGKRG
jgi:hypothetical protein